MLHGSLDHFLGNAVALYITGMACEHAFGRLQFVFLYFGAALAGSALSLTGLEPGMPAVGASGAIFGLMGAVVAMMGRHRARLFVRDKRIGWVVLFWAAWTVLLGFMTPYVDNLAHIGGFAGGAVIGWFLRPAVLEAGRPSPPADRILFALALAGVVGMTVPWIFQLGASDGPRTAAAGPPMSARPPIFPVYGL
jgi:rhomboid protease GluP